LFIQPQGVGLLNEIMTSNNSTVVDLANDYSDWVELYNPLTTSISMDQFYLSDNADYLNKWPFPAISIPAQSFKMIWANDDEELNRSNLNFKLSASGESLFLSKKIDDAYQTIEHIEIPALSSDFSYGKSSDGGSNWIVFNPSQTSPNASNGSVGMPLLDSESSGIFPNPVSNELFFNFKASVIRIYDAKGSLIENKNNLKSLDVSNLPPGFYSIVLDGKSFRMIKN
jgi:hypothetical protein